MSNSLAVAVVTETLRQILDRGVNASLADDPSTDLELAGTSVTTRPPDRARTNQQGTQLNIFLYQTSVNAAWRNQDMPRQVRPGETGRPPLPLNLHYLVTAYGSDDDGASILAHRLMGRAMSILHDTPILRRGDLQAALAGADLHEQIESIHIIPLSMSVEEISKLWTSFQTQYRISAAYQVMVVLIESNRPINAPLPVLQRGESDRGPLVSAVPPPVLSAVRGIWKLPIQPPPLNGPLTVILPSPGGQPTARLGDSLVIVGANLPDENRILRLENERLEIVNDGTPLAGGRPGELRFDLPDPASGNPADLAARHDWAPGFYTASLILQPPGQPAMITNKVPWMLAPSITLAPLQAASGEIVLTVECSPRLRPGQERRAFLLFGSRQIAPESVVTPDGTPQDLELPTVLTFRLRVEPDETGTYTCRLRIDGVDSLPFAAPANASLGALIFDPEQQVTVQ
jgi:hypothetical protein